MIYIVKAADEPGNWPSLSHYGMCSVVGLKYGPRYLAHMPEFTGVDVTIHPGLDHSLEDEADTWEAIYSSLYDLLQTDAGGNLEDGDEFEVELPNYKSWVFKVQGVHVIPVDPPAEIEVEVLRRREERKAERASRWAW